MRVVPKLSDNPNRPLRPFESRESWLIERLANTLAELAVTQAEWEEHFGVYWPGHGYRKTMEAQRATLIRQIKVETGEDVEC